MKVSFPIQRPAATPARRRGPAAPRADAAAPSATRPAESATARAASGSEAKDQWLHESGSAPPPAAVNPPAPLSETISSPARDAAAEAPTAPALDPGAEQARRAAEDVRREVQARPQTAGVHGNLVPATVLNLLG